MKKIIYTTSVFLFIIIMGFSMKMQRDAIISSKNQLPIIEISIDDEEWPIGKDAYLTGDFSMTGHNLIGNMIEEPISIRARGNGSLHLTKKSYKIKFEDRVSLINGETEPARDWLLLANYTDSTMMRNFFALESMKKLDEILFAPSSRFVEVIFNDEYQGIYLLCEPVELDPARIDIDDELTIVENGFLIERDIMANYWGDRINNVEYFTVGEAAYSIKSNVTHERQGIYAASIIEKVEQAIYSKDQVAIEEAMDIPSSIDTYLLYEFTKNIDVGWGSFYMHIYPEDDTLHFGSPWDFDLSLGNGVHLDNGSYEGIYVGNPNYDFQQVHPWYQALMQQEWYQLKVKDRWNEIKHIFLETNELILELSTIYHASFEKDLAYWRKVEFENTAEEVNEELKTFTEEMTHLIDWIDNRYTWLDNYFNNIMLQ